MAGAIDNLVRAETSDRWGRTIEFLRFCTINCLLLVLTAEEMN